MKTLTALAKEAAWITWCAALDRLTTLIDGAEHDAYQAGYAQGLADGQAIAALEQRWNQ